MPSIQTSVVLRKQLKPQSSFTSIVFKRSADDISKTPPSGGSFASPVPAGWSDDIPAGDNSEAAVWMSMRVFTSDGKPPQTGAWTDPVKMVDTQEWDYAYSSQASPKPDPPAADGNTIQTKDPWHNDPKDGDIWMAMRRKRNDKWSAWSVVRIKGEKGDQGEKGEDADFHTIEAQSQSYRSDSKYECYVKWDGKAVLNATTTGIWGVFLNAKTGAVTETIKANHFTDNGKTQAVKDFFLRIYAHYAKAKEEILCMVVVNAGFYATDWPTEGGSVEGNLRWNLQTYWGAGQDLDFKLPATNVSGRHAFVFIGQGGVGEDIPIWEKTYISTETQNAIPQVTINKVGYVSGGKLTAPKKGDKGDNAADTLEVSSQSYNGASALDNCFIKWNGQKLSGLTMDKAALYVVYINPNTGTLANVSAPIRQIGTYGAAGNLESMASTLAGDWRNLPVGTIVAILSRDFTDFTQSTNFRKYLGWLGAPADLVLPVGGTLPAGGRVGFAFIAQKSVLTASPDGVKNVQTSICAVYATKPAGENVVAAVSANFAAGHMLSGGQKGDKGDQGAQGLDGAIHRVTEWAVGKSYNDGTKLEGNYRYLDIVTYENNAYQCIKAFDNSQRPPDQLVGSYWSLIQAMKPINTPLILADNAILKFASSQQLLLRNNQTNVTYAGLAANVPYPLWVGGTDGAAAPFRVSTDGSFTAAGGNLTADKSGNVSMTGKINAQSGTIGGINIAPNYIGTQNSDGTAVNFRLTSDKLEFYRKDGGYVSMSAHSTGRSDSPVVGGGLEALLLLSDTSTEYYPLTCILFNTRLQGSKGDNAYGRAFRGTGHGVLDGVVEGYGVEKFVITDDTINNMGVTGTFLLSNTSGNNDAGVSLTSSTKLCNLFGESYYSAQFAHRVAIINIGSSRLKVYGYDENKRYWCPQIYDNNNNKASFCILDPGDAREFLLIFDASATPKYTARQIAITT